LLAITVDISKVGIDVFVFWAGCFCILWDE